MLRPDPDPAAGSPAGPPAGEAVDVPAGEPRSGAPSEAPLPSALAALFGLPEPAGAQGEDPEVEATAGPDGAGPGEDARDPLARLRAGAPVAPDERSLAGRALVGEDLAGLDLGGWDLSGCDLSRANLSRARLLGADLSDAILFEAVLDGAECLRANLHGVRAAGARLSRCGLGQADLGEAQLIDADLSGATLTEARLDGADLRCAKLQGARAPQASWRGSDLRNADLRGVEFDGSDLHGAVLDRADLRGASLQRLRHYVDASWIGVDLREIDFTGAYLCRRFIMDQNYLVEFRSQGPWNEAVYRLWWLTSDCGRSILRWGLVTVAMVALFAGLYGAVDIDYGGHPPSLLSRVYFSVVTLTTLGFGDVLPASRAAQVVVMGEVVTGYLMLGGLLSIVSNKMVRRAE